MPPAPAGAEPASPALAKHMPVSPPIAGGPGQGIAAIVDLVDEPGEETMCSLPFYASWMRPWQSRPAASRPFFSSLQEEVENVVGVTVRVFKAGAKDDAHTQNAGFVAKVKEDVRAVNSMISATAPLARRSSSFTVSAHLVPCVARVFASASCPGAGRGLKSAHCVKCESPCVVCCHRAGCLWTVHADSCGSWQVDYRRNAT